MHAVRNRLQRRNSARAQRVDNVWPFSELILRQLRVAVTQRRYDVARIDSADAAHGSVPSERQKVRGFSWPSARIVGMEVRQLASDVLEKGEAATTGPVVVQHDRIGPAVGHRPHTNHSP